jgi:signal transduction histidine kinase
MQLASDPALAAHPELRQRLRDQARLIEERIERELNRARLAGEGRGSRRFRPDQDLPLLVDTLRRLHAERDIEIDVQGLTATPWPADREDMMELLGNLADNACKWARGRVRITLGPGPEVCVEDDGPGIPDAVMRQVGRRGTRLDESVPGHGLGLSIVRDIVEHYSGELALGRSADLGGMSAHARLGSADRAGNAGVSPPAPA